MKPEGKYYHCEDRQLHLTVSQLI